MNTILVPVDFSTTTHNAADYAAGLAKFSKAKLLLFHVYSVPIPLTDVPVDIIPMDAIEKRTISQLNDFNEALKLKHPGIETETITRIGFVIEEILLLLAERTIDLVVMGLESEGKPGFLGNITTSVMQKAKCPVLIIHNGIVFKKPETIALACDYSAIVPDEVVARFKDFVSLFNSKVLIFDVLKRAELVSYQKAAAEVNLENSLGDLEHSIHYPSGDNMPEETKTFIETNRVDMLVMIPHNYPFLQKIFHRSNTNKMAFQTNVPLLSIHE